MVKICLCIKVHIPVFHSYYRFSDLKQDHRYFNENEVQHRVKKVCKESLSPFLESVRSVNFQGKEKFKAGISISGITIMLLKKYAPEILEQLIQLEKKNVIEILSEPWSHSILPYFDSRSLIRQVGLHDKQVHSVFGKIPKVFIIHSPLYLPYLLKTISLLDKKAVFTNLNQIENSDLESLVEGEKNFLGQFPVLPVNYKLSHLLQKTDRNPFLKSNAEFPFRVIRKFNKSGAGNSPVVVVRNVALVNDQFHLSRKLAWKNLFSNLLKEPGVVFLTPSEAAGERYHTNADRQKLSPGLLKQSKIPDLWLKEPLQKEAFAKQMQINTLMHMENRESLVKDWDLAQDMQHLYFINSKFEDEDYRKYHFNPFNNPESAYLNYMNVLNDFSHRLNDKNITIRKTESSLNYNDLIF